MMPMTLACRRLFSLFLLMISLVAPPALATETPAAPSASEEAQAFVETLVGRLSAIAGDETLADEARQLNLRTVLEEELAVEPIGKFLFAGAPTDLATDKQAAQYRALFPEYIAASFATEIGELAEREIRVQRAISRGGAEAIIQSELFDNAGRMRAKIDWRVRWIEDEPRLLDVMVERVSPLVTKRQEFSSLARREGVDALLQHMQDTLDVDGAAETAE